MFALAVLCLRFSMLISSFMSFVVWWFCIYGAGFWLIYLNFLYLNATEHFCSGD